LGVPPLPKHVAFLPRYATVSAAANHRYSMSWPSSTIPPPLIAASIAWCSRLRRCRKMRPVLVRFAVCLSLILLSRIAPGATQKEDEGVTTPQSHFIIVSSAKHPAPDELAGYLEEAWHRFHDVFGVKPATVKVVGSGT